MIISEKIENSYPVFVDWLSIFSKGIPTDSENFRFVKEDFQTPQFKTVGKVYYRNDLFAWYTANPHSEIIRRDAVIVKFENRFLYYSQFQKLLSQFYIENGLKILSITRLDVCCDFTHFSNNYHPAKFLNDFFSGNILKNGRAKFKSHGTQKNRVSYEYVRFGQRQSGQTVYLYNKTKELSDVNQKPWINEFWTANNMPERWEKWRLEFSCKPSGKVVMNKEDGSFYNIMPFDIFDNKKLIDFYSAAIHQYFRFKTNTGIKNKSEMPDIEFLPHLTSGLKIQKLSENPDDTKTARILLRQLVREYTEADFELHYSKPAILETIKATVYKYSLHDFVTKNLQFFEI
jgi:hypothetical protein